MSGHQRGQISRNIVLVRIVVCVHSPSVCTTHVWADQGAAQACMVAYSLHCCS